MEEELDLGIGPNVYCQSSASNEKLIRLNILLVVYFYEKRYNDARQEVAALIGDPEMAEHRAYLFLKLGQISELQGDFDETLRDYYQAFTIGRCSAYIRYYLWNHIGVCWLFKRKFKVTEWCCRKAIDVDPNRGDAWKNLGVSLEYQGKMIEAWKCYSQAILLEIRVMSIVHLRQLIRHASLSS